MFKIEYEIKLNDDGRPYVHLPVDYINGPEDRFFALEIANYIFLDVYTKRSSQFDNDTAEKIRTCIGVIGQISDEVAVLIKEQMILAGEQECIMNNYCFGVNDIEELYSLPEVDIVRDGKIFNRHIGMKIYVYSKLKMYQLVDGIENDNWMKI